MNILYTLLNRVKNKRSFSEYNASEYSKDDASDIHYKSKIVQTKDILSLKCKNDTMK